MNLAGETDNGEASVFTRDLLEADSEVERAVEVALAATGICVVPLTGFCCTRKGFRVTLLECDDEKRRWTWHTIAESIKQYLASA